MGMGLREIMTSLRSWFVVWMSLVCVGMGPVYAQKGSGRSAADAAEQLFAMANQARARAGAPPLAWDPALAAAARKHCERMVAEGPIEHQYRGEADLSERASVAGAHFGLIEENIALGPYPAEIHEGWMNSPGHRRNMLNPDVDMVGIAVIARGGSMYAVEDFSKGVAVLTRSQVEAKVSGLIHTSGLAIRPDPRDARAACDLNHGMPSTPKERQPGFIMRWQSADLGRLPQALVDRLGSREYRIASVGACSPQGDQTAFTQYRVAVLLY